LAVHCIVECYVNQWAYVLVGICGYSYMESGRKVVEIFKAQGWSSVVTSHLVEYVLGCTIWTIGIVNGLLSMITEVGVNYFYRSHGYSMSFVFGQLPKPQWWSFG
jgi:Plasma-membrane choline transporter